MLKIGDFSKLTKVSIRMLRHYDEVGLLPPAYVDVETNYRYYSAAQLPRLNRILALQDLGFSLKQIAQLLINDLPLEQMRGMLLQKQAELEDEMRQQQERLARVAVRLKQIEVEGQAAPMDVLLKTIESQWVMGVRDKVSAHTHVGYLFERLFGQAAPLKIDGLIGVLWHDDSCVEDNIDAEAFLLLSEAPSATLKPHCYELNGGLMATAVHHGSYNTLPTTYDGLVRWLDDSGYVIAGPNRELYLHYTLPSNPDDDSYITEIQFPVKNYSA